MALEFHAYIRPKGSDREPWKEHYVRETDDAHACAQGIVDYFNSTLREGEKPRELVRVEVVAEVAPREHDWDKMNLYTLLKNGRPYDAMKCTRCGVTGKRWRLGQQPRRDSMFRAKVYERCDLTLLHRAKRAPRFDK